MKKSIKRLLVLTQVLGWSALVATACTDNDKPVSKTADASKDNTKTDSNNKKAEGAAKGSQTSTSEHTEAEGAAKGSQKE